MKVFTIVLLAAVAILEGTHARPNNKIVGGDQVNIESYPYQVSLQFLDSHFCGGSIIGKREIVTAAHCTDGKIENETIIFDSSLQTFNNCPICVQTTPNMPFVSAGDLETNTGFLVVTFIEIFKSLKLKPILRKRNYKPSFIIPNGTKLAIFGTLPNGCYYGMFKLLYERNCDALIAVTGARGVEKDFDFTYPVLFVKLTFHVPTSDPIAIWTNIINIFSMMTKYLSVRVGSTYHLYGGEIIKVAEIKQHPLYNKSTMDSDISVIILESDITFSNSAKPIALPEEGQNFPEGTDAEVTGWGVLWANGPTPVHLQGVVLPVVSREKCQAAYPNENISDTMICAGYLGIGGMDACQGDSGGPLEAYGKLAGVVSWGYGCADKDHPGIFANVASLRSFIKESTGI